MLTSHHETHRRTGCLLGSRALHDRLQQRLFRGDSYRKQLSHERRLRRRDLRHIAGFPVRLLHQGLRSHERIELLSRIRLHRRRQRCSRGCRRKGHLLRDLPNGGGLRSNGVRLPGKGEPPGMSQRCVAPSARCRDFSTGPGCSSSVHGDTVEPDEFDDRGARGDGCRSSPLEPACGQHPCSDWSRGHRWHRRHTEIH